MSSVDRQFDAIVVGAGPAGSIAALNLARAQHRVLLIDRYAFPRDKICGDGLPPAVIAYLQQAGIKLQDLGTPDVDYEVIEGLEIGSPALKTLEVNWRPTVHPTIACPRQHFDRILFDKAIQQGSCFFQGQVDKLLFEDDKLVGVRTRTEDEFRAAVVIAADGYSSTVARRLGVQFSTGSAIVSAVRAYARLKQPVKPYFHMHFLEDLRPGYAWLFPIGNGLANVGLGLAASQLNSTRLKEALVDYLGNWWSNNVELEPDTVSQWPIPLWNRDTRARYQQGVFITGDAGAFVDPLTGGGISAAVMTGTWAAQSVDHYLSNGWSLAQAGAHYETQWRAQLKPMLDHMHRVKTYVVDRPWAFTTVFNAARYFPFLKHRILTTLSGEHT